MKASNNQPLISVAMVTYNSEKFLDIAIKSILKSTYSNFELVISDDCSQDSTWKIINSYKDQRIRAYRNEKNIGEYPNRNQCLNLVKGEYIIYIDGDDYIYKEGLQYLSNCLNGAKEFGMILGREWDENIIYPFHVNSQTFVKSIYFGTRPYLAKNFTKILFSTEKLRSIGGFSTEYRIGDSYIQLKMGLKYPVLFVNDGFSWWRRTSGQASSEILKNGEAMAESFHFKKTLLSDCPLSQEEKRVAKLRLDGIFARFFLKFLLKGKLNQFIKLVNISSFSYRNWINIFSKPKRDFTISNI